MSINFEGFDDIEEEFRRGDMSPESFRTQRMHNISNRVGCANMGGEWVKPGVCMLADWEGYSSQQYGWTAPIHGIYFTWEINDWNEDDGEFAGMIWGCLIKGATYAGYPGLSQLCHQVYGKYIPPTNYIGDVTREKMLQVAYDSMHGDWAKHGLKMMQPPREPHPILPDYPYLGYEGIEKDFSDHGKVKPAFKIMPRRFGKNSRSGINTKY